MENITESMTEIKGIFKANGNIRYQIAKSLAEFGEGEKLFREYAGSLSFGLDFQGFEQELACMREKYASPEGALVLCFLDEKPIGCVGIRKNSDNAAELKRLYVKPEFRSLKIGQKLMDLALAEAKKLGYAFVRLDTIAEMRAAIDLYRKLGFYEIDPYCFNPFETAIYMEREL